MNDVGNPDKCFAMDKQDILDKWIISYRYTPLFVWNDMRWLLGSSFCFLLFSLYLYCATSRKIQYFVWFSIYFYWVYEYYWNTRQYLSKFFLRYSQQWCSINLTPIPSKRYQVHIASFNREIKIKSKLWKFECTLTNTGILYDNFSKFSLYS